MVFDGESYKKGLTDSLDSISTCSKQLLDEARKSDMWRNRDTNAMAYERKAYQNLSRILDTRER